MSTTRDTCIYAVGAFAPTGGHPEEYGSDRKRIRELAAAVADLRRQLGRSTR